MVEVLQRVFQKYRYVIDDLSDHRTRNWWLMESPGPILTILAAYLFFCTYAGPQYMKDRKPYQLKGVLMVYNLFQILLSIYLTVLACIFTFSDRNVNSFRCWDIDYSDSPEAIGWAGAVWWYFFAKITELFDTVFFVLRKKNNQVSFLHLYHHTLMPMLAWFGTKYTAGGQAIPEGGMNSFIHILMYSYYFLAGLGPQYHKYLWWKKYLTILQLVQFSIVVYLNITGFMNPNCRYPKSLNIFVICNCVAFLYMFGRFYVKSYSNSSRIIKNSDQATSKKDS